MKNLLIIRHAKSGWDNASLSDRERPLSDRGKSDAIMMAKRLKDRFIEIDLFMSSPAKRAKKTAEAFMKEYEREKSELQIIPSLYEARVNDFYDAVEKTADQYKSIALFSHNPGITEFVNSLDCNPVYDMPTCAIFALKIKTDKWEELPIAEKEFLFFDYPKA
jgi:phosphohistidine phosphatase